MLITWTAIAAILGIILGWEGTTSKNDERYQRARQGWPKILLLVMFGAMIAAQVSTFRGFIVVYLSSLGAYYLFKPLGALAQRIYYKSPKLRPELKLQFSSLASDRVDLSIRSKSTSPVIVETVILKDKDGKVLPLKNGIIDDRQYDADRYGWLKLEGATIRGNGSMCIALNADNWNDVSCYRVIGKYSNDMHWLVENLVH